MSQSIRLHLLFRELTTAENSPTFDIPTASLGWTNQTPFRERQRHPLQTLGICRNRIDPSLVCTARVPAEKQHHREQIREVLWDSHGLNYGRKRLCLWRKEMAPWYGMLGAIGKRHRDRQLEAPTDYELSPAWSPASATRSSSSGRGSVRDSRDSRDAAR